MKTKIISVIGLGYIGLPTAALLASKDYRVFGIDNNEHVVDKINKGKTHIAEPELDIFVRSAVVNGRLQAFSKPQPADIYIICVPTPFYKSDSIPKPNIDYILEATRSIAPLVKAGDLVILESTSPVGTTSQIKTVLHDEGVDVEEIYIAYCPERVLPGNIMRELVENNRVIGGLTSVATNIVAKFYRSFVSGEVLQTDAKTAEMCKLTENSFRDVNIAFANELSLLCEKEGINVWSLIELANHHPRLNILQPGIGVGGHCIAVDPWFIVARDKENSRLIRTAREVNNYKTKSVIEKIKLAASDANARLGKKCKIACLGLTYKPNIDDLRESPALKVTEALMDQGYNVVVVEPNIKNHSKLPLLSRKEAMEQSDVIAVLVKHREFTEPNIRSKLLNLEVLDFCGVLA
jgi:UDP-N-acetyl-D-mannosaminuronic acid dehydrogenase